MGCLALALTSPSHGDWIFGYRHDSTTDFKFHGETKSYAKAIFLRLGETKARIDDGRWKSCIVDLDTQTAYLLNHRQKSFEQYPHPLTLKGLMSQNEEGRKVYELSQQMGEVEIRPLESLAPRTESSQVQLSHRLSIRHVSQNSETGETFLNREETYSAWLTADLPLSEQQLQLYKALRSSCAAFGLDSGMRDWLDAAMAPDAIPVEFELVIKDRFNETHAQRKLMEIREEPPDPAIYRPPADYKRREFKPENFMSIQLFKNGKKVDKL
jgi:hypothetical protein